MLNSGPKVLLEVDYSIMIGLLFKAFLLYIVYVFFKMAWKMFVTLYLLRRNIKKAGGQHPDSPGPKDDGNAIEAEYHVIKDD